MTTDKSSEREAFETWFKAVEEGDGEIPLPTPADGKRWDEYVLRHALAWGAWQARAALPQQVQDDLGLPPMYMLAKLQLVVPVLQEARDALTAITEAQRKLHGISASLADRMDEAGTFSLDDWYAAIAKGERHE